MRRLLAGGGTGAGATHRAEHCDAHPDAVANHFWSLASSLRHEPCQAQEPKGVDERVRGENCVGPERGRQGLEAQVVGKHGHGGYERGQADECSPVCRWEHLCPQEPHQRPVAQGVPADDEECAHEKSSRGARGIPRDALRVALGCLVVSTGNGCKPHGKRGHASQDERCTCEEKRPAPDAVYRRDGPGGAYHLGHAHDHEEEASRARRHAALPEDVSCVVPHEHATREVLEEAHTYTQDHRQPPLENLVRQLAHAHTPGGIGHAERAACTGAVRAPIPALFSAEVHECALRRGARRAHLLKDLQALRLLTAGE
mmetsp:Transcript_1718/g.5319  ORF Transcript_1718/g.5319 Transcript_1718/m.5319 type:complete len:314 (+) Transcript_1718:461-1402(+)